MSPKPNPIRSRSNGAFRDLFCTRARACLSHAVRFGWPGYSCAACPLRGLGRAVSRADLERHAQRRDDGEAA
jgi:hypothetical protein